MLSQRVPNFAGIVATEHTPFGHVGAMRDNWSGSMGKIAGFERVSTDDAARSDPFNELYIRTWRDLARYAGPEALGQQGPGALMQLPMLMEEILDTWDRARSRPQFKAEYVITHNIAASLTEAAKVSAQRLGMNRRGDPRRSSSVTWAIRVSCRGRTRRRCPRSCSSSPRTAGTTARRCTRK